eukprot:1092463-Prymnesium_polylepis.1
MKQSGAVSGTFKQSFYNDHHENAMVIKDREVRRANSILRPQIALETARAHTVFNHLERYIPAMNEDELRQPLWVQLTLSEYDALKRGRAPNLPEGHRYTAKVWSGGGGRTLTHVEMVELHVDDAD